MTELLEVVASWPTLLLVIVVLGFTPGFCLRLIVLAYPSSDARRGELIAELYAVPHVQRPLWVAEQLEVALFEGLGHRVSVALRQLTRRRRARALGIRLRRHRKASGVTREVAGYTLRVSCAKIGRAEQGKASFNERDVADLLTLYGVTDEQEREEFARWLTG